MYLNLCIATYYYLKQNSTICPHRIQGDFHVHPYIANAKRKYRESGKQIPIDDMLKQEVRKSLIDEYEEKGIIVTSPIIPSYKNALNTIFQITQKTEY